MLDFDFAYCHGEDGRFHANLGVSLDMSSERVFIHDYGDGPFLYGFDFSGNQLVAQQVTLDEKETFFDEQALYHLSKSVFITYLKDVDTKMRSLKLFQVNHENQLIPFKKITLFHLGKDICFEKAFECFDHYFFSGFQVTLEDNGRFYSVYLHDFGSGEQSLLYDYKREVNDLSFNWHMQEIA